MREIKFRAWDRLNKRWLSTDEVSQLLDNNIAFDMDGVLHLTCLELNQIEWVEFTGLTDKNGKEIYEGDITNNGVVVWRNDWTWDSGGSPHPGFYFQGEYIGEEGELSYHTGFDEYIEVIGNIYENPELLEG